MKAVTTIVKASQNVGLTFRFHFIFTSIGSLLYIGLIFFLWRAIYSNSGGSIEGMTFEDTFLYLAIALSIFGLFQTWAEWRIAWLVKTGEIIVYLMRPIDFQLHFLADRMGFVLNNLISISLPALILIFAVLKADFQVGWNIPFFFAALAVSYLISFLIDFMIGCISFYTESIWGISMTKEVVVLFLSGAVIPLPFFPEGLRRVVDFLPFQAIYHVPLKILIERNMPVYELSLTLLKQSGWLLGMFVLSRLFFSQAKKVITVNGG